MKTNLKSLARRYLAALRTHLKQGPRANLQPAHRLGREAVAIGLDTLGLARIHEQALVSMNGSFTGERKLKRAEMFFIEALIPIEKTHKAAQNANIHLNHLSKTLDQRSTDLAASYRKLMRGIAQRKAVEKGLKNSGHNQARLLEESHQLQKHLRQLTHRILAAHEDKRTTVSRNLHDEIAQTLLGINVRLLTLRKAAAANTMDIKKEIASTQRLVTNSVQTINRFARGFGIKNEI